MPPKQETKKVARRRQALERDRAGDLFADVPSDTEDGNLRVSFRRNWYSPPFTESGEVDYEVAANELADELTGGTILLRNHLQNGELGYAIEIPLTSKDELERILRTIRKVYKDGLKQDKAVRQAALAQCQARLAELETAIPIHSERRADAERRMIERRTRPRFGRALFRKRDRRFFADRRDGMERRFA